MKHMKLDLKISEHTIGIKLTIIHTRVSYVDVNMIICIVA